MNRINDEKQALHCKDSLRPNGSPAAPERLLRVPQVLQQLSISRSLWWAWVKSGKAPAAIKIAPRVTCWRQSEINALIDRLTKPQA